MPSQATKPFMKPQNSSPDTSRFFYRRPRKVEGPETDMQDLRYQVDQLTQKLEQVMSRVRELEDDSRGKATKQATNPRHQTVKGDQNQEHNDTQLGGESEIKSRDENSSRGPRSSKPRNNKQRGQRKFTREGRDKSSRNSLNEDSTTQPPEPSSEDRVEGEELKDATAKPKIVKRKKLSVRRFERQHLRRAESSDRNSNHGSLQNEVNGNDNRDRNKKRKSYPELSETEVTELVEKFKLAFLNCQSSNESSVISISSKGPKVCEEFCAAVLDHAICDVTSPSKLGDISRNLHSLIMRKHNKPDYVFCQGLCAALKSISDREDQIIIDAPRYLDTLGRVLGDCLAYLMETRSRHQWIVKKLLVGCLQAYGEKNRVNLLLAILKSVASSVHPNLARDIWDRARLKWSDFLPNGVDVEEFVQTHDVQFTVMKYRRESKKRNNTSRELDKFADDVTNLVESQRPAQDIDDLFKGLELFPEEQSQFLGTQIYAIVRGCLETKSGEYKLNNEILGKYSGILTTKHKDQDAIALKALTALTKLWHEYQSPQDMLRTIFMELHNMGTVPYEALKAWLDSESLTNIPGIGAARLNTKRYIEDLGLNQKS